MSSSNKILADNKIPKMLDSMNGEFQGQFIDIWSSVLVWITLYLDYDWQGWRCWGWREYSKLGLSPVARHRGEKDIYEWWNEVEPIGSSYSPLFPFPRTWIYASRIEERWELDNVLLKVGDMYLWGIETEERRKVRGGRGELHGTWWDIHEQQLAPPFCFYDTISPGPCIPQLIWLHYVPPVHRTAFTLTRVVRAMLCY